jgi:hypothetical protein
MELRRSARFTGRGWLCVWPVRVRGFVFALGGRRAVRLLFGGQGGRRCCSRSGRPRRGRGDRCSGRRAGHVPRLCGASRRCRPKSGTPPTQRKPLGSCCSASASAVGCCSGEAGARSRFRSSAPRRTGTLAVRERAGAGPRWRRCCERSFGELLACSEDSVAGWGCVPAVSDLNRKGWAAPRSGERRSSGRSPSLTGYATSR